MEANVLGAVLNGVPQKQSYYFEGDIETRLKEMLETRDQSKDSSSESQ
jgi:hypothetical protein